MGYERDSKHNALAKAYNFKRPFIKTLGEMLYFAESQANTIEHLNGGIEISLKTELIANDPQTPHIDQFTALEWSKYLHVYKPLKRPYFNKMFILCQYYYHQKNIAFDEQLKAQIHRNEIEHGIIERVQSAIQGSDAHRKKLAQGCLMLVLEMADLDGCFAPLLSLQIPDKQRIISEFKFSESKIESSYGEFVQSSKSDFYGAAVKLVKSIQQNEHEKIGQYIGAALNALTGNPFTSVPNTIIKRFFWLEKFTTQ